MCYSVVTLFFFLARYSTLAVWSRVEEEDDVVHVCGLAIFSCSSTEKVVPCVLRSEQPPQMDSNSCAFLLPDMFAYLMPSPSPRSTPTITESRRGHTIPIELPLYDHRDDVMLRCNKLLLWLPLHTVEMLCGAMDKETLCSFSVSSRYQRHERMMIKNTASAVRRQQERKLCTQF